jgi:hypothetical protein
MTADTFSESAQPTAHLLHWHEARMYPAPFAGIAHSLAQKRL